MCQVVIENPVVNSLFEEPQRHFKFDDGGITVRAPSIANTMRRENGPEVLIAYRIAGDQRNRMPNVIIWIDTGEPLVAYAHCMGFDPTHPILTQDGKNGRTSEQ